MTVCWSCRIDRLLLSQSTRSLPRSNSRPFRRRPLLATFSPPFQQNRSLQTSTFGPLSSEPPSPPLPPIRERLAQWNVTDQERIKNLLPRGLFGRGSQRAVQQGVDEDDASALIQDANLMSDGSSDLLMFEDGEYRRELRPGDLVTLTWVIFPPRCLPC